MAVRGSFLVLFMVVFQVSFASAVGNDSLRSRSVKRVGPSKSYQVRGSDHCVADDLPGYLPKEEIASVCREVNRIRARMGLTPVRLRADLCGVAQNHSREMAVRDILSHKNSRGLSSADRLREAGIRARASAENVASGYMNAQRVVSAWMDSSGHRRNILYPDFEWMGVGFDDSYWTQVFLAD